MKQLKIGGYQRVSTEEQAALVEGSLDNQRYRLNAFVDLKNVQEKNWGKIVDWYVDDGYSAKDTRRPAFQRMMSDLRKGKIDLILVADLSRLSRNIQDFCEILEILKTNESSFLSIKEQFDSSTPAGKMMLYLSGQKSSKKQTKQDLRILRRLKEIIQSDQFWLSFQGI
jgi:site-specific DNA recombinase